MSKFKVSDSVGLKAGVVRALWRRSPPNDWPMRITEVRAPYGSPGVWHRCAWALNPGSPVEDLFPEGELEVWPDETNVPDKSARGRFGG